MSSCSSSESRERLKVPQVASQDQPTAGIHLWQTLRCPSWSVSGPGSRNIGGIKSSCLVSDISSSGDRVVEPNREQLLTTVNTADRPSSSSDLRVCPVRHRIGSGHRPAEESHLCVSLRLGLLLAGGHRRSPGQGILPVQVGLDSRCVHALIPSSRSV